ncbi:MAG: hypothetical protein H6915_07895 [Novosphingobium sp.]|nr:hypothetical protein [Novosphingobium sp.]
MRAARFASFTLCAIFGLAALASGLDRMALASPQIAALLPGTFHARSDLAAATALAGRASAQASTAALQAIRSNPADGRAAALLGAGLLQAGEGERAARAFRVAALAGWRDPLTQAYWYEMALKAGDYTAASRRADALLRAVPRAVSAAALLAPLEASASGRAALIVRLRENPPWRAPYVAMNDVDGADAARARAQSLLALAASGERLGCSEIAPGARALLGHGLGREARQLWRAHCDTPVAAGLADADWSALALTLKDGAAGSPFGWMRHPSADIALSAVPQADGGFGLRLWNSGTASAPVLSQPVSLAPGRYRVRFGSGDETAPERGRVMLGVSCDGTARRPEAGPRGMGWQIVTLPACANPLLSLWLAPGGGAVTLGQLRLDPVR